MFNLIKIILNFHYLEYNVQQAGPTLIAARAENVARQMVHGPQLKFNKLK